VGYAPDGWDGLVSHLQANGISPLAAEKVGLILPRKTGGGHYDRFRNRLMFAIVDTMGRVVGFSGRILPDPETGIVDKETGKYVNSPESAIYRKGDVVFGLFQARQTLRSVGHAVLVEGNFDVVSMHARGFTNVVAPLGTAFTPMQAKLIKRICPKLVLMFDGDSAGLDATRKSLPTVVDAGLEASVAVLPPGWDPDAFVRDCGEDGMREVLSSPRGLIEHLVDQDLTGFGSLDVQGRVARLRSLLDTLGSISDPAVRSAANTYVDGAVAKATDDSVRTLQALRQELASKSKKRSQQKATTQKSGPLPRPVALSLKMLGCLIDQPELVDDEDVQVAMGQGLDGDIALTAAQVRKLNSAGADAFLEAIPQKVRRFAASRIACPKCEGLGSARALLLSCNRLLQVGNRVEENACLLRELETAPAEDDKVNENLTRLYENMVQGQHAR
jgi:DNA primase